MYQIDLDLIPLFETWYEIVVVIPRDILCLFYYINMQLYAVDSWLKVV